MVEKKIKVVVQSIYISQRDVKCFSNISNFTTTKEVKKDVSSD